LIPPAQIVIVEDEPVLAQAIRINLENLGYCVPGIFPSGEEAIEHIRSAPPDLVIMDVGLQGRLDGVQTAERIHLTSDTPIIFTTAHSDPQTIKRAISTAPFGYIVKPFQTRELHMQIEMALQNRAMEHKIHESEERYRQLTELSPFAILLLRMDGTVELGNPSACELFGAAEPTELVGRSVDDLIPVDELTRFHSILASPLLERDSLRHMESRVARLDGHSFPVEVSVSLMKDDQGNPAKIIAVIQDISEKKAAQQAILDQAARANTLARVTFRVNRTLELDQVLKAVREEVTAAFGLPGVTITLIDEETNQVSVAAADGALEGSSNATLTPFPAEFLQQLWRMHGLVAQIPDLAEFDITSQGHPWPQNIKSVVIAFLVNSGNLIGSITIPMSDLLRQLNDADLSLLAAIADLASITISHARLFKQVVEGRRHLQSLSRQLVEVQEAERRHLAHELHDQIGQMLTGLQFSLEMGKVLPEQEVKSCLATSQEAVKDIIAQVRELSLNLRPSLLDDMGLLPCLDWHFERYTRQTGIQVQFPHHGLEDRRFPPEIEITIYRIIQEALTNVARHTQAPEACVVLQVEEDEILINIQDHGQGFDLQSVKAEYHSIGLNGMRERANLVGGELEICSAPGSGTQIQARIPTHNYIERRKNGRNRSARR